MSQDARSPDGDGHGAAPRGRHRRLGRHRARSRRAARRRRLAVVVHYAGNPGRAEDTVGRSPRRAARRSPPADVADEARSPPVRRGRAAFGGVDVVVNTAGIMLLSPLADLISTTSTACTGPTSAAPSSFASRLPAASPRRRDHQLLVLGGQDRPADYTGVRRHQGRSRGDDADPGQGAARPRHHRQRRRPRPDRDPLFLDGKDEATVDHLAT